VVITAAKGFLFEVITHASVRPLVVEKVGMERRQLSLQKGEEEVKAATPEELTETAKRYKRLPKMGGWKSNPYMDFRRLFQVDPPQGH
jgi:hypothetical protein